MPAKIVTTPHYHIWTDALHARELARQAKNRWDQGTYVRWAVTSAWTAFEMCCGDALGVQGLGMRFKERVDDALEQHGLPKLTWGSGLWQQVSNVYEIRKRYTHVNLTQQELFADIDEAEEAIKVLRDAIRGIYTHVSKTPPGWEDDDYDRGWDRGSSSGAHLGAIHPGVDMADPDNILIAYVYKGKEHVTDTLPPNTDPGPYIEQLLANLRAPISAIRIYRGTKLLDEQELAMRGT